MTMIAIIGTAGRGAEQVDRSLYALMVSKAWEIVQRYPDPHLVSGGAAVADHVAVTLHLLHKVPLTLHLPAEWNHSTKQYTGSKNAATANYYHHRFSKNIVGDEQKTLTTLDSLLSGNEVIHTVSKDFWARNALVAKDAEVTIAFTWGETQPPAGGTAHTWGLCKGTKIHISLQGLK